MRILSMIFLMTLGACASLPRDGPSARKVQEHATSASHAGGYDMVPLDYRVAETIAAHPAIALANLAPSSSSAPVDRIGEGDALAVTVYTAGAGPGAAGAAASGDDQSSKSFPRLVVDRNGTISVPFAGEVSVAGLTVNEAAAAIRRTLRGKFIDPQVGVVMAGNVANAVTVFGEVRNPGRVPLSAGFDHLLDVIAVSGGTTRPAADVQISVVREGKTVATSLAWVLKEPTENIRLAPRDQVRLAYRPRKFSAFGALARTSQSPIEDESLSLASALGRAGGLDSNSANAASVLVFRFERPEVAKALGISGSPVPGGGVPVVYRLDLRDPSGYFIANKFEIQPDDLIYAPRSDTAELGKFFELVRTITQVAYDLRVAAVLP